jgi:hypothetical protein
MFERLPGLGLRKRGESADAEVSALSLWREAPGSEKGACPVDR